MRAHRVMATAVRACMGMPLLLLGCAGDNGGAAAEASTSGGSGATSAPASTGSATETGPATTQTGSTTVLADSSGSSEDTTSSGGEACGNGIMEAAEECDDGNRVNADGCNIDCVLSGSILWSRTESSGVGAGEQGYDIAVDSMGVAYVAGDLYSADPPGNDLWLGQYSPDGDLNWSVSEDHEGTIDVAEGVAYHDGIAYVVGVAGGTNNDLWLRSFDSRGTPDLDIIYDDVLGGSDRGQGVAVDPLGDIVVVGRETYPSQGNNGWIRKYDPMGGTVWTLSVNGPANGTDILYSVAVGGAGDIVVGGFQGHLTQGRDIWIGYYDTDGVEQWTYSYSEPGSLNENLQGVALDGMGNVVATGWYLTPEADNRLYLAKFDPAGTPLWRWEGPQTGASRGLDVAVDGADDIVVVGDSLEEEGTALAVYKFGPNGDYYWGSLVVGPAGTAHAARGVATGPGDDIWIAGGLDSAADGSDIYVARMSP